MVGSIPLASLLQGLPYTCVQGDPEVPILEVCEDSRRCSPGALFVAIRGISHDGHAFLQDAVRRGARALLCQEPPSEALPPDCTVVTVPDTRTALSLVAHRFYGEPSAALRLIGITGTNGKTTTSFFIRSVLERAGVPTGIIGTTGAFFRQQRRPVTHTTPTPVELNALLSWLRSQGAEAVALEVSSHALDQRRVEALRFAAAVFTNISHDHLDYHGTIEAYAQAKRRLFELLPEGALALAYEAGDGRGAWMLRAAPTVQRYCIGVVPGAEFQIRLQSITRAGTEWSVRFPDGTEFPFRTGLLGEYNAVNATLAIALGWGWGIDIPLLQEAIAGAIPPPGRMEPVALPNGAIAFIDYAHTPDALERALRTLKQSLGEKGHLICVFGCGGNRDRAKRPQMGAIAAQWADFIVLTNDNPRHEPPEQILEDIRAGIPPEAMERVLMIPDREAALQAAAELSTAGDCILIAGKGHEEYQILGDTVVPFSDRKVIERIAQMMGVAVQQAEHDR